MYLLTYLKVNYRQYNIILSNLISLALRPHMNDIGRESHPLDYEGILYPNIAALKSSGLDASHL